MPSLCNISSIISTISYSDISIMAYEYFTYRNHNCRLAFFALKVCQTFRQQIPSAFAFLLREWGRHSHLGIFFAYIFYPSDRPTIWLKYFMQIFNVIKIVSPRADTHTHLPVQANKNWCQCRLSFNTLFPMLLFSYSVLEKKIGYIELV